jgi:peptidoglycan/xylan/chitin deacetylase (PgdA/CDA1 family)
MNGKVMSTSKYTWPHGHRVAVIVSVLAETWSLGKSPSYFPRTSPLKAGHTDIAGINWSQYGGREGIWRITRTLDEFGIRGTYFCNGRIAELYPEAIAQVAQSGHDIAGHGYYQDELLTYMAPEEERATIRKTLDLLEKASGTRPQGWVTPIYGWSERTMDFLVQEKLQWCSDALDANVPRQQKTTSGSIVVIPWSDFVDNRVLRASPRDFYDVYKDTFDYLYAHEPMGLINIGFHSHFGGRPLMTAMLRQVLGYCKGFPQVWFPLHREIAQWMIDENIEDPSYAKRFFG